MTIPAVASNWPVPEKDLSGAGRRAGSDLVQVGRGDETRELGRAFVGWLLRWLAAGTVAALQQLRRSVAAGAVLLTLLLVHAALAPHLAVGPARPDVLLAAVVAVGTGRGSRAGAGFGFAAGLGADLFLATPLGTSALAYTLVGHLGGRAPGPHSAPGTARALCGPDSACFACRTARHHTRARQRATARRQAMRRSLVLTGLGVAAGTLGTTAVATTLGGVPFPGPEALSRAAGAGALTAPLAPVLSAGVRRFSGWRSVRSQG